MALVTSIATTRGMELGMSLTIRFLYYWSMGVLLELFSAMFAAKEKGLPVPFGRKGLTFIHFHSANRIDLHTIYLRPARRLHA